jgi:hypothetical protein
MKTVGFALIFLLGCIFIPDIKEMIKEKPKVKEIEQVEFQKLDLDSLFVNDEIEELKNEIDSGEVFIQKNINWSKNVIPNAN